MRLSIPFTAIAKFAELVFDIKDAQISITGTGIEINETPIVEAKIRESEIPVDELKKQMLERRIRITHRVKVEDGLIFKQIDGTWYSVLAEYDKDIISALAGCADGLYTVTDGQLTKD